MTLKEAGLNLPEEEYRKYQGLSYSILSRYDREGYGCVDTLFEPLTTPSLSFGSMVDCLLTQGNEAFGQQYGVVDISLPSDTVKGIMDQLHESHEEKQLALVSDEDILLAADSYEYQRNWKGATRALKLRELGSEYYNLLKRNEGKTLVSETDYFDAVDCVANLKSDTVTSSYFSDDPFDSTERLFQWQYAVKDNITGIDFKGMLDLVLIDHEKKRIIPCDIKTTSNLYTFESSFYKYRYYLQAAMYTELLMQAISKSCQGLENYTIEPYRFIVVSRYVAKPVVFEWDASLYLPDLTDPQGNTLSDWRDLMVQLDWILHNKETLLPKEWHESIEKDGKVFIQRYAKK